MTRARLPDQLLDALHADNSLDADNCVIVMQYAVPGVQPQQHAVAACSQERGDYAD
jgi:hypothetical protein